MKNRLSKTIVPIICVILLFGVFININRISNKIVKFVIKEPDIVIPDSDKYFRNESFRFVSEVNNFTPYSQGDLINIFYTIIDHGWKEFTFYCPREYVSCLSDVKELSKNQDLLTHINNFVHPFHSFYNLATILRETGEVHLVIEYLYSDDEIKQIDEKVDELYRKLITPGMKLETKIKTIHDYIINNTKYDILRNDKKDSLYHSYIAYGPLFEGYATCGGYSDLMSLFLEKMHVPNFKVAKTPDNILLEDGHVWNAVYINNKWKHLDLTWDDPVSSDGKDYLQYNYFLIDTEELEELDNGDVKIIEHQFPKDIYLELKTEN